MDRYIWFINSVPEHEAHPILFEPNKLYRFQKGRVNYCYRPAATPYFQPGLIGLEDILP